MESIRAYLSSKIFNIIKWNEISMMLITSYNEYHRYFHTLNHIESIIDLIDKNYKKDSFNHIVMTTAALFHDIVYIPGATDNEEKSIIYFNNLVKKDADKKMVDYITKIIKSTNDGELRGDSELNALIIDFNDYDRQILRSNFNILLEYEKQIFKEYQYLPYIKYKEGRIKFLNNELDRNQGNIDNIYKLIEYLKWYKPNIGLYAGSFKPFHLGHYDILQKAEKIFDKVIIAKGVNAEKLENIETFSYLFESKISNRQLISFVDDIISLYNRIALDCNLTIIRGLRNGYDLQYEQNYMNTIRDYDLNINFCMFYCDKKYEHISSSMIRNLKYNNMDVKKYLI